MIRLNRMTDYGIVVMTHLADGGGVHTAPEIAEATGLARPTVAKLLKVLTQNGLAVSQRGVRGGYALARPPEDVSMAEAIEALDGPVALAGCVTDSHEGCDRELLCAMSGSWNRVNAAIRATLEKITLAEMMAPFAGFGPPPPPARPHPGTDPGVAV